MRLTATAAALALLLPLGPNPQAATHKPFEARVIGVADGDTITVLDSNEIPHKIRLAGIDAPEKGQPFGDRSKQNLSRWVYDQNVLIEWSKLDKYGRMVSIVRVAPPGSCVATPCKKSLDVNLAQVAAGFAWHYKLYENEQSKQDRLSYDIAEQHAREMKLGLWKDPDPVPPWEWRHGPTEGPIKKSQSNICHGPDTPSYRSLKHFTSYQTLEECIASGGRLPKSPGG
jgi:endonuclease YncB( thermonuclease family)